ncbi:MAG: hypothetical protein N4A35_06680 [Flavobacteriales bacterium]|jgi:hypothetical protein|nr:hypothetical protein [Flavobacteriales bacterium]
MTLKLKEIIKRVNTKWVHQIRAGYKHSFIDISIVEVENRFFVRQYRFGKRSWYHAFIEHPEGEMKLGDLVVPILGVVPKDLESINPKVNKAFFKKMSIIYWLMGLTYNKKRHEASTLELIPIINNENL